MVIHHEKVVAEEPCANATWIGCGEEYLGAITDEPEVAVEIPRWDHISRTIIGVVEDIEPSGDERSADATNRDTLFLLRPQAAPGPDPCRRGGWRERNAAE